MAPCSLKAAPTKAPSSVKATLTVYIISTVCDEDYPDRAHNKAEVHSEHEISTSIEVCGFIYLWLLSRSEPELQLGRLPHRKAKLDISDLNGLLV